jgi:hypothetical protein
MPLKKKKNKQIYQFNLKIRILIEKKSQFNEKSIDFLFI